MKIECVVVCEGYADFLAQTLPRNLPLFEHVTVVTGFEDSETIELCRELSVQCIPTDCHKQYGDLFNKGKAIDLGLSFLRRDNWVLHLDADMYLPPMTRRWLELVNLEQDVIYGIDRVMCVGWDKWQTYIAKPPSQLLQHRYHCLVDIPQDMPMGHRIALKNHTGVIPLGFFQLFHGSYNRRYPTQQSDSAEHSDVTFALQWPSNKRQIIPEVVGIHLESEPSYMGVNWKGRKTKRFGPPLHQHTPRGYAANDARNPSH